MFVYCTCCHHWLCSIVVGGSLLESVIVPHESALYGCHVINGDVAQCLWGHMWLWFWSGVACSWTVAAISGFVALWCVVAGVGSNIGVGSGCGGRKVMCKLKDEIACT